MTTSHPGLRYFIGIFTALFMVGTTGCTEVAGDAVEIGDLSMPDSDAKPCGPADELPREAKQQIDPSNIDQTLFDDAVRYYSGFARCQNGGERFFSDEQLREVAIAHSADMRREQFFDHRSTVSGKETLSDRYELGQVRFRAAAENLAKYSLFNFRAGVSFQVIDKPACRFFDPDAQSYYRPRTYAELAEAVVVGWINSPGHRANLFSPVYSRMGSGLAIDLDDELCGEVYATQNFAD